MKRLVALVFLLAACGPAPGYNADGQFVADPNAGLASPRRGYDTQADPAQSSGGQQPPPPQGQPGQGDPSMYDNLSAAQGQQPAQPAQACDDSCRFGNNGECDDGRPGSDTDVCAAGTDCTDCGR